ncbi:MAG: hypothetical protein WBF79_07550 [Rhodococcus sp. (in: high G+C Gram-positive bacteria)]
MFTPITVALYALPLLAAIWATVKMIRGNALLLANRSDRVFFRFLVGIELLVLAQAVVGFIALATTDRDVHALTFGAYLVGLALLLPIGVWWSLGDRSRGGTAVLIVVTLTLAAMVLRLNQIWDGYA